ncbi:hypothetical protein [Fischerella thermalis]|uniref:hypothetical protein n=1 Tax=Fischerella thermalis TaxID=372787 RepID=UPI0015E0BF80|nr:hypothetical protein [Fischerella thermalis]
MAGTLSSGRPGGNPELEKYQFKAKGNEPLTKLISLRVTDSTMEFLKTLGKDYPEFVRQAIAEKMEREAAPTTTKTVTTGQEPTGQPQQHSQTNQEDQEQETNSNQKEQATTLKRQRKAGQTQEQKQGRPKSQSRSRKNSVTEN